MKTEQKPWELSDQQIDDLTPNSFGKNITEGHEIAREAQRKLLEYLFKIGGMGHGGITLTPTRTKELCKELGVKI